MRRFFRNNGLSVVAFGLFLVALVGQAVAGYATHAEDQREHGEEVDTLGRYLGSGHFLESVFENWESEFLQMALFVILTAVLVQRGSAESHEPNEHGGPSEEKKKERQTRADRRRPDAPWPVRVGGVIEEVYSMSLSLALGSLFVASFVLHAVTGLANWRTEQVAHGQRPGGLLDYVGSAQFWFESFQNWQSEFLAVGVLIVLTIFLRQRGSAQSKAVGAPHAQTGPG
jgi:hypothetical protein